MHVSPGTVQSQQFFPSLQLSSMAEFQNLVDSACKRGGKTAREHAARSARSDFNDVFRDPDTVWCHNECDQTPDEWRICHDFPEIPRMLVESKGWSVVLSSNQTKITNLDYKCRNFQLLIDKILPF